MAIAQLALTQVNPDLQNCIQNCLDCHSICLNLLNYCIPQGGSHAELGHLRLLLDCAEICQTSANFMLRGSELHSRVCGLCAEVCERCAQDCERFSDDQQMMACAEICRRCSESCRQMAMATV